MIERCIRQLVLYFGRNGEDGETIVKTASDNWVVGKRSDQREFYVVINQKNANLIEINGKIHEELFISIVFFHQLSDI